MNAQTYQLFDGDCLEVMATLEAQSVDAIIVDPPYGTTACSWDVVIPFAPMWKQVKRIIKPRGAVVMFGSEPFSSLLRVSNLEWYKYDWVWEKEQGSINFNAPYRPIITHEFIHVFSNGASTYAHETMKYNPQMTKGEPFRADPQKTRGAMIYHSTNHFNYSNQGTRYPVSVQKFATERGIHPTQKPVSLLEYLVKTYTNPGDTVLDFTMGSCPTGKASIKLGRNFIGIDNGKCEKENSEYYGWSWVEYARVALANIAGEFTLTPQEKAAGQMALFTPAYA